MFVYCNVGRYITSLGNIVRNICVILDKVLKARDAQKNGQNITRI